MEKICSLVGIRAAGLALGMVWALVAGSGCGTDDVGPSSNMVGGRCSIDSDCVKRCITGTAFPGGYCTVNCSTDSDCPGGAACIASSGGICVAICNVAADCTDYGTDYQCARQTRQAGGASVLVCAAH